MEGRSRPFTTVYPQSIHHSHIPYLSHLTATPQPPLPPFTHLAKQQNPAPTPPRRFLLLRAERLRSGGLVEGILEDVEVAWDRPCREREMNGDANERLVKEGYR